MEDTYLTTFQAAKVLSVSPDSVLKWIKSGKLIAYRTPGGHYRIARKSIEAMLEKSEFRSRAETVPYQYCWEFNTMQENCMNACEDCVVFRVRARCCYKMRDLPVELDFSRVLCNFSCDECKYYQFANARN